MKKTFKPTPIRKFYEVIPMTTCYMTTNPDNGKPMVDYSEAWDYVVPAYVEHDKWYYQNALNEARSIVGERWDDDEAEGCDTRTYFRIDPMNPDHADLINAWADMVFGSFYRFSMRNDGRAEKMRKLDWAGREDVRSIAIESLYTEYSGNMHDALRKALNAIDRHFDKLRQAGDAEYNPNMKAHNLPTPHGSLMSGYRDKADALIAECIGGLSVDHQIALEFLADGVSLDRVSKATDRPRSTVQRTRYRAIHALLTAIEAHPDYWYMMEKMAVVETDEEGNKTIRPMDDIDYMEKVGYYLECARKAKGKK